MFYILIQLRLYLSILSVISPIEIASNNIPYSIAIFRNPSIHGMIDRLKFHYSTNCIFSQLNNSICSIILSR